MDALERAALAKNPLTADEVRAIVKSRERIPFPVLLKTLVRLAESHERLRMELEGAEKMLEAFAEKFNG